MCAAPHSAAAERAELRGGSFSFPVQPVAVHSLPYLFMQRRTKGDREESRVLLALGLRSFRVIYFHFLSTAGIIY